MSAVETARTVMLDVLADDPFASNTAMVAEAMERIQGNDLDRRWLDALAFEVSETAETCF